MDEFPLCVSREGVWWGGWFQQSFQAVRDKSAEAYEFLKRDLTEFSNVIQHDTTCSIVATASAVRSKLAVEGSSETTEKVKKSLSNILGVITDTLAPPPDKTIDCDVITLVATPTGTTEVYDSTKARLYSLQADPATYCNEPDGPPEQFEAWLSTFNFEEKKPEISELLVQSRSIRALYLKMVPAAVSPSEFWQRYFYKVYQLDQEEARRVALKQRAEQTSHNTESLGWEDEEEDEFLGATSTSRLDFTPPLDESPLIPPVTITPSTPFGPSPSQTVLSPSATSDAGLSVSSDSTSLPTQMEVLSEKPDKGQKALHLTTKTEIAKEEVPQDLRVFELNSDSGKSTPSNNGKKGSSTDISEDWEKDFDLDMTEEEVQLALSKLDATGELEDEDWENWE
uniref:BSD domain-containing protein n=1 Tax=Denticeps clupeoides TaxID=299321 RepID=A0AAY4AU74_9TELE